MRVTGERDGFLTRPLSYFEDMYDTLAPNGMCKLYLAKLNTEQALANIEEELAQRNNQFSNLQTQLQNKELNEKKRQKLQNRLEPEANKLNNLTQQKEELQKLYEEHLLALPCQGIVPLTLVTSHGTYNGASDNVYREFMPNYYISVAATSLKKLAMKSMTFWNQRKTDESDPLYGLYRFKSGIWETLLSSLGEFDYVIDPIGYFAWTKLLPQFKKIQEKLRQKKH